MKKDLVWRCNVFWSGVTAIAIANIEIFGRVITIWGAIQTKNR